MNLENIRQQLRKGGNAADAAIRDALKQYPVIYVKAYNSFGDGIIEKFTYTEDPGRPYAGVPLVHFHSFGDGVDSSDAEMLATFTNDADKSTGYRFSWLEERLHYKHMVKTYFDRKCLDEAYRQAAEWLEDDNIAKRKTAERARRLVNDTYRRQINSRYFGWSDLARYSNGCNAVIAAAEEHFKALQKMDDESFTKVLDNVFQRNEKHDRELMVDGKKTYDISI